jgi:hypothetical protein
MQTTANQHHARASSLPGAGHRTHDLGLNLPSHTQDPTREPLIPVIPGPLRMTADDEDGHVTNDHEADGNPETDHLIIETDLLTSPPRWALSPSTGRPTPLTPGQITPSVSGSPAAVTASSVAPACTTPRLAIAVRPEPGGAPPQNQEPTSD